MPIATKPITGLKHHSKVRNFEVQLDQQKRTVTACTHKEAAQLFLWECIEYGQKIPTDGSLMVREADGSWVTLDYELSARLSSRTALEKNPSSSGGAL